MHMGQILANGKAQKQNGVIAEFRKRDFAICKMQMADESPAFAFSLFSKFILFRTIFLWINFPYVVAKLFHNGH